MVHSDRPTVPYGAVCAYLVSVGFVLIRERECSNLPFWTPNCNPRIVIIVYLKVVCVWICYFPVTAVVHCKPPVHLLVPRKCELGREGCRVLPVQGRMTVECRIVTTDG